MLVHAVLVQHTSACNMQAKAGPAVGRFGHIYILFYITLYYLSVNLCFLSALIVYTHTQTLCTCAPWSMDGFSRGLPVMMQIVMMFLKRT